MKTYGGMQEKLEAFITSALDTEVKAAYPFL
jgi:hypothetical protein